MHIDNYIDAIKNCRFCFMCRFMSAIGNVTFTEADTPRVRAAMIYGAMMHPEQWGNRSFIDTLYRSDLSACCVNHCVNHYDENSLNIAARMDIVEKSLDPDYIRDLQKELVASATWKIQGSGKILYFADQYTAQDSAITGAFDKLMKKMGKEYATVTGGCIGRAMFVLGYLSDSICVAQKFADFINSTGAETLVVSSPAAYHSLTSDYPVFGIKLNVKVMHTSEFLLEQAPEFSRKAGKLYYLESDYLRNYDHKEFPHDLLKKLGAEEVHFGTNRDWLGEPNQQESYSCGEGAVVLPRINPEVVKLLAEYVAERADNPAEDKIVVAAPYTKFYLKKYTALNVFTLEEIAAECL